MKSERKGFNPIIKQIFLVIVIVQLFNTNFILLGRGKTTKPSARMNHGMIYDIKAKKIILEGGIGEKLANLGDTWMWNGKKWKKSKKSLEIIIHSAYSYDYTRNEVICFGGITPLEGYNIQIYLGPTCSWNGKKWTAIVSDSEEPTGRIHHSMTSDSLRKHVVLFGGKVDSKKRSETFKDTWEWDGKKWEKKDVTGPEARSGHAMAFDKDRGRVVLFGGLPQKGKSFGDTWEWDGKKWYKMSETGPDPRHYHCMVYMDSAKKVIIFGGTGSGFCLGDMWEWDGSKWSKIDVGGPPPRLNHAMAYDLARDRVILFGGLFFDLTKSKKPKIYGDMWAWDGQSWEEIK